MRRATRAAPGSAGTAKPCQAIYGRCATSGQAERPTPPTPRGGGGHPGATWRGEPEPQPSSSRRGLCLTTRLRRRSGFCLNPARAPVGVAGAAGEASPSRARLAGPGVAQPQRNGLFSRGTSYARGLLKRSARAGWAHIVWCNYSLNISPVSRIVSQNYLRNCCLTNSCATNCGGGPVTDS